jgi:tripartite-type tricarboxylate transporter receptor subunit TctC
MRQFARRAAAGAAALLTLAAFTGQPARADAVSDFYKGKTLTIYVGYTAGGGYDLYARTLAQFYSKFIPGHPTIVVSNMPGAGSLKLANWMYAVAPKDGTAMATIARGAPVQDLLGDTGVHFDASKFNWIGSMNNEVSICATSYRAKAKTFDDMKKYETVMGGQGRTSDSEVFARFVKNLFGLKIKIVSGYPGTKQSILAMERGEVDGNCGWSWSSAQKEVPEWIKDHKLNIIMQMALQKHPDMPKVPLITEFAKNDDQKQQVELLMSRQTMGRPFFVPQDVPADRVAALRKSFMDTIHGPAFQAFIKKGKIEVDPVDGKDLQDLVVRVRHTAPEVVAEVRKNIGFGTAAGAKGKKK